MKRNRVNVLTVVNSDAKITAETIDGKPHIVVRGVTSGGIRISHSAPIAPDRRKT